jgi:AcrR family transcriptional regulator
VPGLAAAALPLQASVANTQIQCGVIDTRLWNGNRLAVKATRRYESPRRAEQARQTRAAVTDAAKRLFLRGGFAATTVAAVAAEARVSVETIYKGFGGKPGLVRAICENELVGGEQRTREPPTEPDPRTIIRGWGRLAAEVAPRVAPILLLLRAAAATDPAMAELHAEMDAGRLQRMTRNAIHLAEAEHLRDGLTVQHSAEIMWAYTSPELYEMLVLARGWPLQHYGDFIADALIAALLPLAPSPWPPTHTSPRK